MIQQKITYFFRSHDKFLNFLERYKSLKAKKIKNEEMFSWFLKPESELLSQFQNWKEITEDESEIFIISSEISINFLKNFDHLKNKKIILVGENLHLKISWAFPEFKILFSGKSIFDILNFLKEQEGAIKNQKILYLRGEIIKYDLKNDSFIKEKISENFKELKVYRVSYKNNFSSEFLKDLNENLIENFVFFSNESFKNFMQISTKLNLKFNNIKIFCLGDFEFQKYHEIFSKVFIAPEKNSKALVDLILEN